MARAKNEESQSNFLRFNRKRIESLLPLSGTETVNEVETMIKNEKEYKFTQEIAADFEKSLAAIARDENPSVSNSDRGELTKSALQSHLDKLQREIAEYERLISHDRHQPILLTLDDFFDFPQLLIKARIAAKLSQKELADLAGLTEEKIRHYEENEYEDASLLEVKFAIDALDIKIQKGEFLVPLDRLRRTPVTKEELLSLSSRQHSTASRGVLKS
jgi:transcriptional regulator with XRE-family HTH domain